MARLTQAVGLAWIRTPLWGYPAQRPSNLVKSSGWGLSNRSHKSLKYVRGALEDMNPMPRPD
jgi:hypothetical protein